MVPVRRRVAFFFRAIAGLRLVRVVDLPALARARAIAANFARARSCAAEGRLLLDRFFFLAIVAPLP